MTAATAAAVASVAGQNTSKSLAGGSQSQENPRDGRDPAGHRSCPKGGLHGEALLARATKGDLNNSSEHEQLGAQ